MKNFKKLFIVLFVLVLVFTLSGCASESYIEKPLGDGFGFWDIFVYPMAGLMWLVGKTIGFGNYALTIIFATLIVRTIAWPIYAKTNDMQLKMKLIQPELNKLQAKYANKQDQESQRRMQMEMMNLYKKNGIGMSGCLMPFIQMPIFLGFYYALRKLPAAIKTNGHWLNIFKDTTLFGIDMTLDKNSELATNPEMQKWGVIVLAILVGVTQLISIILSERRQKKAQEDQQAGIPEYRRQQNQNQNAKTTQATMKFMLYFMAAMMVVFVLQSPAGLGLYWVIGNIYSTLQSTLGQLTANKKLEKMKAKRGY